MIAVTNDYRPSYIGAHRPMVTKYAYDELGNMTNEVRSMFSVSQYGEFTEDASQRRVTWFEYDKMGRRIYRFLPTSPVSIDDATNNVTMEKTTYSKVGANPYTLRKTVRDFRGITITFEPHTPTIARAMPTFLIRRLDSFSTTNAP